MRIEKDSLGTKEIPDDVYYGVQTYRAVENFPISGIHAHPVFIKATVQIKKAAAKVNLQLGLLDKEKSEAIVKAANEILSGKLQDQFVVDIYQAGAGTSHNMNTNEVLANRAIELLGGKKGHYKLCHPNDHVNMAQSTNDVIPTAIRLSSLQLLKPFYPTLDALQKALEEKAIEFDDYVKSGRTHLQDATPVRLGQEFSAYAKSIEKHKKEIQHAAESLKELGIGGTAVGSGLNTHPKYRELMAKELSKEINENLTMSENYFEAMQSIRPALILSATLRNLAVDLSRIANDLRLLASGPGTGLAEILLPPVQPGSSIMPGKVNPVMAEMLNMVCFQVIGFDTAIMMATQAGQMELNVMMPLIAFDLCHVLDILNNSLKVFTTRCIQGITANQERCLDYAKKSLSAVTAFNAYIGYEKAAEVAKESLKTGKTIPDLIVEKGYMTKKRVAEILQWRAMTEPGIPGTKMGGG